MNDGIFELWSLPWHALQQSLANRFGTETAQGSPGSVKNPNARVADTMPPSNWLTRARSAGTQAGR